jgi:uncharacterized protein (DUF1800 family)
MPTASSDVAHLLRRAAFGGTKAEIAALAVFDLPTIVDKILDTTNAPADVPPASFSNPNIGNWERLMDLVHWWLDRMATSPTPIVEKMTLFWHGHFTSSEDAVNSSIWLHDQNALFRRRALGDLRLLTQEMALQPAMLQYLDNRSNTKYGAQQNFARELMELFTMGVGNYTETDVAEVARAWTGHTINWPGDFYEFRADFHDIANKTIFGVTKNWDGPDVIDAIFTVPAKRTATATNIVAKLWTFFAYPNPSASLVAALAAAFEAANFDIKSLLRVIFLRPEFYSATARNALVRSPTEFVVAVLRCTGLAAVDVHPEWFDDRMGQALFFPPNVAGWKNNSYWLTTSTLAARAEFADHVNSRLDTLGLHPLASASTMTVAQVVDAVVTILDVDITAGTRTVLTDWVTRTRAGANRWTLKRLVVLALLAPEFHVA